MKYESKDLVHRLPAVLLYQAIGMIVTMLAVLLLALFISGGVIPSPGSTTVLCCVPGAFLAGFLSARRIGRHILPVGLVSGTLFLLLLLLIGTVFLPNLGIGDRFGGIAAACLAGGVIGAMCTAGMRRR